MGKFLRKDLLLFWRDRKEVAVVVLLPLLLIVILTFAMGGFLGDGDDLELDVHMAFVLEDEQSAGYEAFENELRVTELFPEEEVAQWLAIADTIAPIDAWKEFVEDPGFQSVVEVTELSYDKARGQVDSGNIDAMLIIPEGYTESLLSGVFLGEEMNLDVSLEANELSVELDVLEGAIQRFIDEINLQFAIHEAGGVAEMDASLIPQGGVELAEGVEPFTLKQYFTIAIGALFGLFLLSTVVSRVAVEKRDRTFNRIILSNSNPMNFLFSKTLTTFILCFAQIMLVFAGSHLLLDVFEGRSFNFWAGLTLIGLSYAVVIAGMSTIFTSLMLRAKNTDSVDGMVLIFVFVFGTFGGGFVPIYAFPQFLQEASQFIPNGLVLSSLTEWFQYESFSTLIQPILYFVTLTIVTFLIGVKLYPKRGESL